MNEYLGPGGATPRARSRALLPAVILLAIVTSWWVLAGVAQAAPMPGSPGPSISGTPQAGQPLTASAGTWTGTAPISYTYVWASGGANVATTGPTTSSTATYPVTAADIGKTITVSVTVKATEASLGSSAQATSAPTAAVLPLPPAAASAPAISGTPQQGQTLTITHAPWASAIALTGIIDQWEQCDLFGVVCTPIPGQ